MPERRRFLIGTMKGVGAATVGGLVWTSGMLEYRRTQAAILRPPAAIPEERFAARCTRCGLCVEACPFKALLLARPGDGRPAGTPYFVMRDNPCRMCRDIPCAVACPTGALDISLVSREDGQGRGRIEVNLARMGIAVIDRESCVAYWGIQCDACYRACPVMDKAIKVEYLRNDRTGKHAILAPVVHGEHCTGCGMCERVCVTEKASIFVLPRHLATGESSARYVKSWDSSDEQRIGELPEETKTVTPRSQEDALDYLNKGGF